MHYWNLTYAIFTFEEHKWRQLCGSVFDSYVGSRGIESRSSQTLFHATAMLLYGAQI
jgi:hypothetical protein